MAIKGRITEYVERLPESMQLEVLNYVEYLITRAKGRQTRADDRDWKTFSLKSAMRGMEDESGPNYSKDDIKEPFP